MLGYRQNVACRNGLTCYYLRNGNCWFYHPEWHYQLNQRQNSGSRLHSMNSMRHNRQINTNLSALLGSNSQLAHQIRRPNSTLFQSVQNRNRNRPYSQISLSDQEQQPDYEIQDNISFLESDISRNYENLISPSRLFQIINKTQQEKQKWYNLDIPSEEQMEKVHTINGKEVKLVKISCQLSKLKSWFFKNSLHFKNFPQNKHKQCSICISNFQNDELLTSLFCKHIFHKQCIQKWLKGSHNCPLCRKDFRKYKQFQNLRGYVPIKPYQMGAKYNHINIQISNDVDYSLQQQFEDEQDLQDSSVFESQEPQSDFSINMQDEASFDQIYYL